MQKFLIGGGAEFKYLKIKSETLEETDVVIDKSSYLSVLGYVKYDSFDDKYFPKKGCYFSGDIQSYLFSSDYTGVFKSFSMIKC